MSDKIIPFKELGTLAQEKFIEHARALLAKGYVVNASVSDLAEQIYDSHIREKLKNPQNQEPARSFLGYDKDAVWSNVKEKDDNDWLK